jgi:hypothetical protein
MVEKHRFVWDSPFVDGDANLNGEEILPIGNGRLGGIMWMPEVDAFCLQLNHVDYWRGGEEVPAEEVEFGGRPVPIGRVSLCREGGYGAEGNTYRQELPLAEGRLITTVNRDDGGATHIEAMGEMGGEALLVRWRETGERPVRGSVTLGGWRDTVTAASREGRAVLTEKPVSIRVAHEEEYLRELGVDYRHEVHAQATVVSVEGAEVAVRATDRAVTLAFEGARGFDVVVRIVTAVEPDEDRAYAAACEALRSVEAVSWDTVVERTLAWWRALWERSRVSFSSGDGSAERFGRYWYVCVYLMAIANQGRYAVKFNRGNWIARTDDKRDWGGGYWYYNERDLMLAMMPANHPELARAFFMRYLDNADIMRAQCRRLWGHAGLFVAETTSPDGTMYLRDRTGIHDGLTKMIQLIFSTSLEVAYNLYQYCRYTGDEELCRERVYPFVRDVVGFFRIHMFKDDDGKYHIYPANGHETFWRVKDDLPDLAGLRAVLPVLIELGERYGVDERERDAWRELLDNLADLPRGKVTYEGDPDWEVRDRGVIGLNCFATAVDPAQDLYAPCVWVHDREMHNCHPVAIFGVYPFLITHAGSADRRTGIDTYRHTIHPFTRNSWADDAIVPAVLGLKEEVVAALTRFADTEWEQSLQYCERYGKVAMAVTMALLQSHHGVIRLFPALPDSWSGSFRLRAEGPFVVEASAGQGRVETVRITSLRRQNVALVNPWPGRAVTVDENGAPLETLSGELLRWRCREGGVYGVKAMERRLTK